MPPSSKGIQALDEMTTTSSKKKCSQARETRENVEKATPVSKKRQGQLFAKQLSKKDVNQDTVEMCESPNAPSKEPK